MNATANPLSGARVDVETRMALVDLYGAYAACLDDGPLEVWPEFFTEDCRYRLVPRENFDAGLPLSTMALEGRGGLRDRIFGVSETLFYAPYHQRHIIGPPRVLSQSGDVIEVTANYLVLRTKLDGTSEVLNCGRYLDRVIDTGAGLLFTEKLCIFDSELVPNSIIYPI
jgi:salicylate 5-hydroxylase small subunit